MTPAPEAAGRATFSSEKERLRIPNDADRAALAGRVALYHSQIEGALPYLVYRGISLAAARRFQLGYTGETGDYRRNRLAIPYLSPAGPWHVKYRCVEPHDCKDWGHEKYIYDAGTQQHLFNAQVLREATTVVVVEGEIDAITGTMAGFDHVGYPGAQTFRKNQHWVHCFDSCDEIVVVADGDEPKDGKKYGVGEEAARSVAESLRRSLPDATVRTVVLPVGYDCNSYVAEHGDISYLEQIGLI